MRGTTVRFESTTGPVIEMVIVGGSVRRARVLRDGTPIGDRIDAVRVLGADGLTLAQACDRAIEEVDNRKIKECTKKTY